MPQALTVMCVTKWYISYSEYLYSSCCIKSVRESKKWTAQFWAGYMDIIQMVFTLIRATKKTTLNCMSALSVCIVPNVNCKRSQQIRNICTCVTDYTYKFIWYTSQMQRTSQRKWVYCDTTIGSLLEKCFWDTMRQTIKRYSRLQQLELRFVVQMEWCITHLIRAQYIETTLQCTEMKYEY